MSSPPSFFVGSPYAHLGGGSWGDPQAAALASRSVGQKNSLTQHLDEYPEELRRPMTRSRQEGERQSQNGTTNTNDLLGRVPVTRSSLRPRTANQAVRNEWSEVLCRIAATSIKKPTAGGKTSSKQMLLKQFAIAKPSPVELRRQQHRAMLVDLQRLVVEQARESRLQLLQARGQQQGEDDDNSSEDEDGEPTTPRTTTKMPVAAESCWGGSSANTKKKSDDDLLAQYKEALLLDYRNKIAEKRGGQIQNNVEEENAALAEVNEIIRLLSLVEDEVNRLSLALRKKHQQRQREQKKRESAASSSTTRKKGVAGRVATIPAAQSDAEPPELHAEDAALLDDHAFGVVAEQDSEGNPPSVSSSPTFELDPVVGPGFNGKLLPFQREGVQWLRDHLYNKGHNGILADDMGLGKTVQTVAFLLSLHNNTTATVVEGSSLKKKRTKNSSPQGEEEVDTATATVTARTGVKGPHLITVPLSTMTNWVNEFERFAPGVFRVWAVDDLHDDATMKYFLNPPKTATTSSSSGRRMKGVAPPANGAGNVSQKNSDNHHHHHPYGFDVVLVPHSSFARKLSRLQNKLLTSVQWEYLVVDEAQRIKSKESVLWQKLSGAKTHHKLALSGTPMQNDVVELWSLLGFLMPEHFQAKDTERMVSVFQALRECQQQKQPKRGSKTTKFTTSSVSSSTASPTTAVVGGGSSFPGEEEEEEDDPLVTAVECGIDEKEVVMCLQLHRLIQPLFLRRAKADVLDTLPAKQDHVVMCPLTPTQVRFLADPQLCKTTIDRRKILLHPYLMLEEFQNNDGVAGASGKVRVLDAMIRFLVAHNHKTLVFSNWTKPLDVVEVLCAVRRWNYVRLDGGTKLEDRASMIERFNHSSCAELPIFFLSKGAGGVGLNLQSADTVIFLDVDYNPQKDAQALSRVYRVGQKKEVRILRLLTHTDTEQRMFEIAEDKWKMEQKVVQAGHYDGKTSELEREQHLRRVATDTSTAGTETLLQEEATTFRTLQKELDGEGGTTTTIPTIPTELGVVNIKNNTVPQPTTTSSHSNEDEKVFAQLKKVMPRSEAEYDWLSANISTLFVPAE